MKKKAFYFQSVILFLMLMFFVSACGETESPNAESPTKVPAADDDPAAAAKMEDAKDITESQPAEPQPISFSASDGEALEGVFFPAERSDAPLIILFHWAPGDQLEWREIAYWLQNRDLGNVSGSNTQKPWLTPGWFPINSESFNVFTFTFRNCEGGCKSFEREKWYRDVEGAVDFVQTMDLPGKQTILMVGASIGADGAVDGCAYANQTYSGICKGAFSLSPGNYLTLNYAEKVKELAPVPAMCLYAETDPESAAVCGSFSADNYTPIAYPGAAVFGNGHGMNLVEPDLDPNALDLLLDFMTSAVE